jgi:FMN phosphatase YigB (HAD superfamily)
MSTESKVERAIVLQLLRDDREQTWSRARLGIELDGDRAAAAAATATTGDAADPARRTVRPDAPDVEAALRRLGEDGVLCLSEEDAWASRATRRLDELGLIGV